MPEPESTVVLRPELAAISYEYFMGAADLGFIAGQVMPIFETPLQSAQYPFIPLEEMLKIFDTSRAMRGGYNRSDWKFDMKNYACKEHGWEEPVDDRERALYLRFFQAEEIAVQRATHIMLMDYEKRVANKVFNASNLTLTGAVSVAWDVPATAKPRDDVKTATLALKMNRGIVPNALIINDAVFQNLMNCAQFTDYTKYTNAVLLDNRAQQQNLLARFLNVGRLLVADSIYDSADKGQAASLANIWGDDYAALVRIGAGGPDLREPCIGRTFLWTGSTPQQLVAEAYREESTRSNVYRVRSDTDEAFIYTGAGYLFTGVTT
jgi:hypothetical protein